MLAGDDLAPEALKTRASGFSGLEIFPENYADEIAQLICRLAPQRNALLEDWYCRCAATFRPYVQLEERRFNEEYVPWLLSSAESLARGDLRAFVDLARRLGGTLAETRAPFAAMVVNVTLLKDACEWALHDDPAAASHALLLLDKAVSCFISAAAERYYDRLRHRADGRDEGTSRAAPPPALAAAGFFHGIVGRSALMQRVFADVRRVAATSQPVLLLGETGTGKELVARAIHHAGPRAQAPFIALNCAALPRDLIEAELFGHRRGAFSGAVSEMPGLFRAAAGGTLLLDEITEMGPDLQAKLLRVLQERTVRPVGAVREEPVDVRVIGSSNRDPEAAVRSGLLRSDVFYRLCVSQIVLPPLRSRREDVAPLVEYFLATLAEREGDGVRRTRRITPDAMAFLEEHPWPGNVRELFNVLENACTMGAAIIGLAELERPGLASDAVANGAEAKRLPTYQETERALIANALVSAEGNKVRAARQLGISRKKLYAKIARYGLATPSLEEV